MKKFLYFIFMSIISAGILTSANIIISSPKAGAKLFMGSETFISWNCPGYTSSKFKINIFKNSISQSNYIEQLIGDSSGKKKWIINTRYTSGNYMIRIKTFDGKVKGDSGLFSIISKPATQSPEKPEGDIIVRRNPGNPVHTLQPGFNRPVSTANTVIPIKKEYLPDLVITNVWNYMTITPAGEKPVPKPDLYEVYVIIKNIGKRDIRYKESIAVCIKDINDIVNKNFSFGGGLKMGESFTHKFSFLEPDNHSSYENKYKVIVDIENRIKELNEKNNTKDYSLQ